MEMGFYHPTIGYWQTTDKPTKEIFATYPEGTLQVPLKPGTGYRWDGKKWLSPVDVPMTVQEARPTIEARRNAALDAGVMVDGVLFYSDSGFLLELMAMLTGFKDGLLSGPQDIRTKSGETVKLSEARIAGLVAAIGVHRQSVYAKSWSEKDELQTTQA